MHSAAPHPAWPEQQQLATRHHVRRYYPGSEMSDAQEAQTSVSEGNMQPGCLGWENDTDMQEGRLIQPFSKYWPLPLTMMTGQNVARNKHNTFFVTRFLMTNASQVSTLTLCWGIKLEIVLS